MISVVLATYNEEKNLKRCLDSVNDFANEVVVVDGSSTDKTRELAKQLGARVIKTTNKPIFHINKQLAMDEAKYKLVLQLDADEVVDEELNKFIVDLDNLLENDQEQVSQKAWWIKRKNNFLGYWLKKGGQYPDPVIRLYIKGRARLPQKSVHEQMEVDGKVGWAKGHLLHYSNPQFCDYLRKFKTYTQLEANKLLKDNQKISLSFALKYFLLKPFSTFFLLFFRHKGFVDGVYGFIFALMSSLHYPVIFFKFIQNKHPE